MILSRADFARHLSLVGYFAQTNRGADAQTLLAHDEAQRAEIERLRAYIVLLEPPKPPVACPVEPA